MASPQRIVLIGLSGTGKSSVGRAAAALLGWSFVDTDDEVVRSYGMSIASIFATHGESDFRATERAELASALARDEVVIATGGGAVLAPEVWAESLLRRPGTLVITLDASPETSLARLERQQAAEGDQATRPLLASDDPLARILAMKSARQAIYDRSDMTLITDRAAIDLLAAEIAWLARIGQDMSVPAITLRAQSGSSAIHIAPGAITRLGELVRQRFPKARRAWIITDSVVGPLHAAAASAALSGAGYAVEVHTVPAGEASKSLGEASRAYDRLLSGHVERGDVVVALGGGVVGDLAGFVAATVLRGVGFVQVPTSLLAMVDSSVGGKTGIDHPAGKNLIGAFHQPSVVVVDPELLMTLPRRQVINGQAEMIKHAIIQPSTPGGDRADLLRFHERNAANLTTMNGPAMVYLLRRNIALKTSVVEADERESGIRSYLNFGHTLGHAIEAANYDLLHGEAIAIGMRAETRLGLAAGTCDEATFVRIEQVISGTGLPTTTTARQEDVLRLLQSDKKREAGKLRFVLPLTAGGVILRDDLSPEDVRAALTAVSAV